MSDLTLSAKGEGSFLLKGQSLHALRVTSMKLLSWLRQTGLGHRCIFFGFTKKNRSAQHLLNTLSHFRILNSLTVKEKRCKILVLNWWMLEEYGLESLPANLLKTVAVNRRKKSIPAAWNPENQKVLTRAHTQTTGAEQPWVLYLFVSVPGCSLSYKFWRASEDSLLPKGVTVLKKSENSSQILNFFWV